MVEGGLSARAARETDRTVGVNIRTARLTQKMSQEGLGKKLELTFQQIQKYEKGTNRVSAGKLQLIADALDVDVAWLLTDHERAAGFNGNKNKKTSLARAMFADRDVVRLAVIMHRIENREARLAIITIAETIANVVGKRRKSADGRRQVPVATA